MMDLDPLQGSDPGQPEDRNRRSAPLFLEQILSRVAFQVFVPVTVLTY